MKTSVCTKKKSIFQDSAYSTKYIKIYVLSLCPVKTNIFYIVNQMLTNEAPGRKLENHSCLQKIAKKNILQVK